MLSDLDSVIVIDAVEGLPPFRARALVRLGALAASGGVAAVSDLTFLECRVKPIRMRNAALLADHDAFFSAPALRESRCRRPSTSEPPWSAPATTSSSATASTRPRLSRRDAMCS